MEVKGWITGFNSVLFKTTLITTIYRIPVYMYLLHVCHDCYIDCLTLLEIILPPTYMHVTTLGSTNEKKRDWANGCKCSAPQLPTCSIYDNWKRNKIHWINLGHKLFDFSYQVATRGGNSSLTLAPMACMMMVRRLIN